MKRTLMAKYLLVALSLLGIPWAIRTWWEMVRTPGPRERAFIARTNLSAWLLLAAAAIVIGSGSLQGRILFFSLPVGVVFWLALRHSWRKTRARLHAEESDPLSRARRIN
jgi:hypothetical protein